MMGLWLWSLDILTPVCAVLLRTGIGIDREVKSLASSFGVWCSQSAGSNEIFFKIFSVILINLAFQKNKSSNPRITETIHYLLLGGQNFYFRLLTVRKHDFFD